VIDLKKGVRTTFPSIARAAAHMSFRSITTVEKIHEIPEQKHQDRQSRRRVQTDDPERSIQRS
jgi:hypothetical protein